MERLDMAPSGTKRNKNEKLCECTRYLFTKRVFDLVISAISLVLLSVPMGVIAIAIRLDSPGGAIFRQERLGKNGDVFTMYKFRSMRINAEENGPQWAKKDDPRCTRVGCLLRNSRLDELPQLLNIFRGDMSFVGPRPERACFYEAFEQYIPEFRNRLAVRPGLTGLAQISGGYDLLPEEKIVFDMEYIRNQSIKMDLYCILKTMCVVFSHDGAR